LSISPIPKSSTPALLEMQVSCFTPFFTRAAMQFSGIPHSPNPPSISTAPSLISDMAASADATTLFMLID
jgi:hypothetical protein